MHFIALSYFISKRPGIPGFFSLQSTAIDHGCLKISSHLAVDCRLQVASNRLVRSTLKANYHYIMSSGDSDILRKLASVLGASGVAAGAFGAHALKARLNGKPGAEANWKTAVSYQLFHATAILALSALSSASSDDVYKDKPLAGNGDFVKAGKLMAVGSLLFSGSIYCLTLDIGPKKLLGPITPIGGLMMIGGWVVAGLSS